ncbi:MAG: hypothetical protein GY928_11185 [Colwellia sp.]|nr:hypothetical protein [Colwellia sp.]
MTIKNIKQIIPNSFLDRTTKGTTPTGKYNKAVYCSFCSKEKNEFLDPRTSRIIVLECECEKTFAMLREFLDANVDYITRPDSLPDNVIKYRDKDRHINFVAKAREHYEQMRYKRDEFEKMKREAERDSRT